MRVKALLYAEPMMEPSRPNFHSARCSVPGARWPALGAPAGVDVALGRAPAAERHIGFGKRTGYRAPDAGHL